MSPKPTKQADIAAEYGMPFWDVVRSYADDGESVTATAEILGYNPGAFRRLVDRHSRRGWFRHRSECNGELAARAARHGYSTPAIRKAVEVASAANPTYRRVVIDGVTDTIAGHARRRGIPVRTAYNRLQRGLSPEAALHRGSYVRPPATNASHRWRGANL